MTWPWSRDIKPLIAGSDLIRLNTATGHGFIRQSGVRARCVFSDLSIEIFLGKFLQYNHMTGLSWRDRDTF